MQNGLLRITWINSGQIFLGVWQASFRLSGIIKRWTSVDLRLRGQNALQEGGDKI